MESTEQSRTCTDAPHVTPQPGTSGHAVVSTLRPRDYAGHIPDAPGHRLYGVEQGTATRDQVTAQREAIGDGWTATGAPLGPDEGGAA